MTHAPITLDAVGSWIRRASEYQAIASELSDELEQERQARMQLQSNLEYIFAAADRSDAELYNAVKRMNRNMP